MFISPLWPQALYSFPIFAIFAYFSHININRIHIYAFPKTNLHTLHEHHRPRHNRSMLTWRSYYFLYINDSLSSETSNLNRNSGHEHACRTGCKWTACYRPSFPEFSAHPSGLSALCLSCVSVDEFFIWIHCCWE